QEVTGTQYARLFFMLSCLFVLDYLEVLPGWGWGEVLSVLILAVQGLRLRAFAVVWFLYHLMVWLLWWVVIWFRFRPDVMPSPRSVLALSAGMAAGALYAVVERYSRRVR